MAKSFSFRTAPAVFVVMIMILSAVLVSLCPDNDANEHGGEARGSAGIYAADASNDDADDGPSGIYTGGPDLSTPIDPYTGVDCDLIPDGIFVRQSSPLTVRGYLYSSYDAFVPTDGVMSGNIGVGEYSFYRAAADGGIAADRLFAVSAQTVYTDLGTYTGGSIPYMSNSYYSGIDFTLEVQSGGSNMRSLTVLIGTPFTITIPDGFVVRIPERSDSYFVQNGSVITGTVSGSVYFEYTYPEGQTQYVYLYPFELLDMPQLPVPWHLDVNLGETFSFDLGAPGIRQIYMISGNYPWIQIDQTGFVMSGFAVVPGDHFFVLSVEAKGSLTSTHFTYPMVLSVIPPEQGFAEPDITIHGIAGEPAEYVPAITAGGTITASGSGSVSEGGPFSWSGETGVLTGTPPEPGTYTVVLTGTWDSPAVNAVQTVTVEAASPAAGPEQGFDTDTMYISATAGELLEFSVPMSSVVPLKINGSVLPHEAFSDYGYFTDGKGWNFRGIPLEPGMVSLTLMGEWNNATEPVHFIFIDAAAPEPPDEPSGNGGDPPDSGGSDPPVNSEDPSGSEDSGDGNDGNRNWLILIAIALGIAGLIAFVFGARRLALILLACIAAVFTAGYLIGDITLLADIREVFEDLMKRFEEVFS